MYPKESILESRFTKQGGGHKDDPEYLATGWRVVSAPHEEIVYGQSVN